MPSTCSSSIVIANSNTHKSSRPYLYYYGYEYDYTWWFSLFLVEKKASLIKHRCIYLRERLRHLLALAVEKSGRREGENEKPIVIDLNENQMECCFFLVFFRLSIDL